VASGFFETFAQTSGNKSVELTGDFLTGNRQFTSPEEIAAFEDIAKYYQDGVLTQESLDTDSEGMRAAFAQQKAAMMYVGSWEIANVDAAVTDFEVGIFEFPLSVDTAGVVPQHGGGPDGCLAIPSFAPKENIDLQAQFLEFVTRAEYANKILQPAAPLLPVLTNVPAIDHPLASELNSEFIPHTIRFLDWIWPVEVNDAVMQGIPAVIVGELTPEEAAANVQEAFDTLVAEKDFSYDWWTSWTAEDWAKVTPSEIPTIDVKE
jgi:raffinose/stachyose/melibiose transport system substrate-binding protein